MKYSETQEPLSESETKAQRLQRLFIVVFLVVFSSFFYFILSEFLSQGGNTVFPLFVMGFIGIVAVFVITTTLYTTFSRTKTIHKGTITYAETHSPLYGNDEYYWYLGEKKISVSAHDFTRYSIGDTVEIQEANGSVTITPLTTPFAQESHKPDVRHQEHRHSTALAFDYEDQLNFNEKRILWFSILRRISLALFLSLFFKILLTFAMNFLLVALPFQEIMKTHTSQIQWSLVGLFFMLCALPTFYIIADLVNNKKIIMFSVIRTIQRYKPVNRNGKTEHRKAYITLKDDMRFRVSYPIHNDLAEEQTIEIHYSPYSKTVFLMKGR